MKNDLNEKQSYSVILASVICTLLLIIGGLIVGTVCVTQKRNEPDDGSRNMARYLLVESAYDLRGAMSALRLCNEDETTESVGRTALVHAVRAETALECHYDDWADSRSREQFLNDVTTILHSYSPQETQAIADSMYEYTSEFFESIVNDGDFEYNGELIRSNDDTHEPEKEVTEEDISAAAQKIKTALETSRTEYVGAWEGHIEFYIERDDSTGYALVCDGKIVEYSFMRQESGDGTDVGKAEKLALETAAACGYSGLDVKWSGETGRSVTVIMCKSYNGAIASDDCATAVVFGGEVVSFTAGTCDCEHKDIPSPKVTERDASRSAVGGGDGVLVVRTIDGKERICYEYRYDMDDGVHYVYVCAENGKQIEVR